MSVERDVSLAEAALAAGRSAWVYDEASRHVFHRKSGETMCIVSDLPSADETHAVGRWIAERGPQL